MNTYNSLTNVIFFVATTIDPFYSFVGHIKVLVSIIDYLYTIFQCTIAP